MNIKKMRILVYGLGVSGISSVKALDKLGAKLYLMDKKVDRENIPEELKDVDFELMQEDNFDLSKVDIVLKSPGILYSNPLVKEAISKKIEVISDLELAYRIWGGENIIAITGTNGKTTTCSLLGHILDEANINNRVIGNIGVGILWEMYTYGHEYIYIIECSSFQLKSTSSFEPHISAILNISPDHLNWHLDMIDYVESKKQINKNQRIDDICILNYDDEYYSEFTDTKARIFNVSNKDEIDGYYCKNDTIYRKSFNSSVKLMDRKSLSLKGNHNVQNALFCIAIAENLEIPTYIIERALSTFKAVEHRIEYVTNLKDIAIYNDSKATNVDSTIKALDSFDNPIILIAGGVDKKVSFDSLFENRNNVKKLILLGENREKIKKVAEKKVKDISLVKDLNQAVDEAIKSAVDKDIILFSPASASFDMFDNFEQRGKNFKDLINKKINE